MIFTLIKAVSTMSTILMSSAETKPDVDFKKEIAAAFNMIDARFPGFDLEMELTRSWSAHVLRTLCKASSSLFFRLSECEVQLDALRNES